MCVCGHLTRIDNAVRVHVLQHRRESHHPIGTTRLLRLGLADVHVHVLGLEGRSAAVAPVELPAGAGLLYPSADARDLATLHEDEKPRTLVVIDGTWTQAHRLFRDNPWIAALPRYRVDTGEGSRYRIRAEPRKDCLSTVESVVAALRNLQPDLQGTEMLLSAFDAMIDAQIEASARPTTRRSRPRVRVRPSRAIPRVLLAPDARIVVVYTEIAQRLVPGSGIRTPLRLSAVAMDGARVFDRLVEAETAPDPYLMGRMGLERPVTEVWQPSDEVVAAFRAFCESPGAGAPPGAPVLATWNVKPHRWLKENLDGIPCVALKGIWANLGQQRVPGLGALVDSLALAPAALPVTGRAGRRLAQAHAVARHILDGVPHAR